MSKYRTHTCSDLSEKDIEKKFQYLDGYTEKGTMVIYCS